MDSKQRAQLKSQANTLPTLFQVGKGGMSDALVAQTEDAFRTRELIKLKALLETVPQPPKEIAEILAQRCGAEVVQVIGGSIILYKENPELRDGKPKKKKASAGKKPTVGIKARKRAQQQKQRREAKN